MTFNVIILLKNNGIDKNKDLDKKIYGKINNKNGLALIIKKFKS